jgi:hypothetical protein
MEIHNRIPKQVIVLLVPKKQANGIPNPHTSNTNNVKPRSTTKKPYDKIKE